MMKNSNEISRDFIDLEKLLYSLFVFLFCTSLVSFGQQDSISTVQLIRIPKTWTDSTRTDQLIITVQSNQKRDTLLLSVRSSTGSDRILYSIPLTPTSIFSTYQSVVSLKESDSLVVTSTKQTSLRLFYYSVPVSRYTDYDLSVPVSMFALRTGDQLNRIPSNHFTISDTLNFEFVIRLPVSLNKDHFGYRLLIQSAMADTVVNSYKRVQSGGFTTITGQIPTSKFGSGRYFIQAILYKNNVNVASLSSLPMYILLSPSDSMISARRKPVSDVSSSVFVSYSDQELNLLFDQAQYIALPEEVTLFKRLTSLSQKQAFMETFWNNRVNDPVDNLVAYTEKVSHVNRIYRGGGKEGYLTDRGKVYLKYGPCEDVFISTSEVNVKPYEVWYYPELKGQSSVYFYFVDLSGYGNYQLIHSTARDEVYNLQYLLRLGIEPTSYREQ